MATRQAPEANALFNYDEVVQVKAQAEMEAPVLRFWETVRKAAETIVSLRQEQESLQQQLRRLREGTPDGSAQTLGKEYDALAAELEEVRETSRLQQDRIVELETFLLAVENKVASFETRAVVAESTVIQLRPRREEIVRTRQLANDMLERLQTATKALTAIAEVLEHHNAGNTDALRLSDIAANVSMAVSEYRELDTLVTDNESPAEPIVDSHRLNIFRELADAIAKSVEITKSLLSGQAPSEETQRSLYETQQKQPPLAIQVRKTIKENHAEGDLSTHQRHLSNLLEEYIPLISADISGMQSRLTELETRIPSLEEELADALETLQRYRTAEAMDKMSRDNQTTLFGHLATTLPSDNLTPDAMEALLEMADRLERVAAVLDELT